MRSYTGHTGGSIILGKTIQIETTLKNTNKILAQSGRVRLLLITAIAILVATLPYTMIAI